MRTCVWLSAAVEKTCDFLVGMVVFLQPVHTSSCIQSAPSAHQQLYPISHTYSAPNAAPPADQQLHPVSTLITQAVGRNQHLIICHSQACCACPPPIHPPVDHAHEHTVQRQHAVPSRPSHSCTTLPPPPPSCLLFLTHLLIMRVKTPPRVSIPSDRGVTSSSKMSFTSPLSTPPWMAAPMATTSSGFTPRLGSFWKISFTISCT